MVEPYYESGGITLYCGRCEDVLPQLEAAVILTDPPYNAGKNYGDNTNDRRPWPEWCAWWDEVLDLELRCAPDVLAFLSQTAYRQYVRLGKHEMDWTAIWSKPLSMAICAAPFMPHWEPIAFWGSKRRRKGDGTGWGSDVIECNVAFRKPRWDHPTPKPLELMRKLVARFDGVIGDPFAGSGTTLVAAQIEGKAAWGIEVEERFCETIARRLSMGDEAARAPHQGVLI